MINLRTNTTGEHTPDRDVLIEDRGEALTIVAFGGIAGRVGMPPYEWKKITCRLKANIVFMRDFDQTWYQNHLSKIHSCSLPEPFRAHNVLSQLVRRGPTITLGNSMGGFAAIAYGQLLG